MIGTEHTSTARRTFLAGVGVTAGLALTRAENWIADDIAGYRLPELFNAFEQSLSMTQREHTFLSSDHPARQITLTEAVHRGPHIGTLFNRYQVGLIRHMYQLMLSSQGRSWMHNTISLEGRFEGSTLRIYSQDSTRASYQNSQVVINGGHFMLRSDDFAGSGYALGGPISYGQQIGNNRFKVEGNAYKAHGDALNQFHAALSESERTSAYQDSPPFELMLQIQGADSAIPGVRIGDVSDAAKEVAQDMLSTIFAGLNADQRSDAWSAIDENGGVDSLHVAMYRDSSFYPDGARFSELNQQQRTTRGIPYVQVWRIEGPAMVIHFKGYPHVHAYMNIVRDPTKIAVGEALTEIRRPLGQAKVNRLIGAVLKQQTAAAWSFYPGSLLGRMSPGTVSTGSIHTLDPFANEIIIAEIAAEAMSKELSMSLEKQGQQPVAGQTYKVATVDYMLRRKDLFGLPEKVSYKAKTMRDALIGFVRDKDLSAYYG